MASRKALSLGSTVLIGAFVASAVVTISVGGSTLVALGLVAAGLIVAFAAPAVIGRVGDPPAAGTAGVPATAVDAAAVKSWRKQNPDSSIADAIRANRT